MWAYVFLVVITILAYVFFRYYYVTRNRRYSFSRYTRSFVEQSEAKGMEIVERKTITVFFVVYLFLLCFRNVSVGVDLRSYINNYFYAFQSMDWQHIIAFKGDELSFSALTWILGYIFEYPQFYIAILAILSVAPIMYIYRREAKGALLCCSFFMISLLFEFFFSGLRQSIAIGLVIPAFYFAKEKRIVPFLLTVAFAMSFHLSAVIILLIYPIFHAKITLKWLWFVVPVMALIYIFNAQVLGFLMPLFGEKYYTKYGYGLGQTTNQYGLLVLFVLISIYCFVIMDETRADKEDIGFRNLLLLATTIQFFAPMHFNASRMNYYFILFIPIALTRTNAKCKPIFNQVVKVASVIMLVYFLFYFFFMKGDTLHIRDYEFFF